MFMFKINKIFQGKKNSSTLFAALISLVPLLFTSSGLESR